MKIAREFRATFLFVAGFLIVSINGVDRLEAAPVLGGFDASRGGINSIADGSNTGNFRSLITSVYPGTTFSGSPDLTSQYLSTITIAALVVSNSTSSVISPLSSSEQSALYNYVLGGGSAFIALESSDFAPGALTADNSLIAPFGMTVAGSVDGDVTATITDQTNPIALGPFAQLSTVPLQGTTVITNLGPYAEAFGVLPQQGNATVVAVIDHNAIAPGSGAVFVIADATSLALSINGFELTLNAMNYALVPEPSSLLLSTTGAGLLLVSLRRRARR